MRDGLHVKLVFCLNPTWRNLAQSFGASKVVGVDIDDTLIRGAWRRRLQVWSAQAPLSELHPGTENDETISDLASERPSKKQKVVESSGVLDANSNANGSQSLPPDSDYFPASFEHSFGALPIPPSHLRGKDVFPHNITFRTADWVEENIIDDGEGYDVVLAFTEILFPVKYVSSYNSY
ncbi:hypothetical protein D9758_008289 [Tetrapyrgos nigripes]|uniref:RNA methyltransferase n=1 Tax=Tetrapyrgos nigripes TaxID=182062 RepID=A0A8H5LGR8_9AGAR|nr:hypothetical protein D9758_008289 [Tetrapyrgos nigripes]